MARWSQRSLRALAEVHPDLRRVADLAQEKCAGRGVDFLVLDGERTKSEQIENKRKGVSQTLISAHLAVPCAGCADGRASHALDFVPLIDDDANPATADAITWVGKYFDPIADCFAQAAKELGIPIERGIDWGKSGNDPNKDDPTRIGWDAGHIELADSKYGWKAKVKALWA